MKLPPIAPSNLKAVKVTPGNIYSTTRLAFLTNPTLLAWKKGTVRYLYPIKYDGVTYPDVEACYNAVKNRSQWMSPEERIRLISEMIEIKLTTYPFIRDTITLSGGVAFLEKCSHTARYHSFWMGNGRQSGFIRALILAYENSISNPLKP